jgi:hypothetical protein
MRMKPRTTILTALALVWPVTLTCCAQVREASETRVVKEKVTATIVDIDKAESSISFAGPNGWSYSRQMVDPTVLDQVRVGDKVDITWNVHPKVLVE